jgi:hypothetical protein
MNRDEAKPLRDAAQHAANWCLGKLEMRVGGYGKDREHADSERAALQVAHSIAVCEIARLTAIVEG